MTKQDERRVSTRFHLQIPRVAAQIEENETASRPTICDLSLSGVGLEFENEIPLRHIKNISQIDLSFINSTFSIPVTPVHFKRLAEPGRPRCRAGLQFQHTSRDFLAALCNYIVESRVQRDDAERFLTDQSSQTEITDERRIERLCRALARNRHHVQLFDRSRRYIGEAEAQSYEEGRLEFQLVLPPGRHWAAHDRVYVSITSMNSHYTFDTLVGDADGDRLALVKPLRMHFGGIRASARVPTSAEHPVVLEFLHPLMPGWMVAKRAIEVGGSGLSFVMDPEEDLIAPGLTVESAQMRIPGHPPLPCHFEVMNVRRRKNGGFVCGIRLQHHSARNRQIWLELLLRQVAPRVVQATQWDLEHVWAVFESSRYLEEKPKEFFAEIESEFYDVWQRILEHHNSSRIWLYREQERVFGTLSLTRIYSDAWIAHHLAADLEAYPGSQQKLNIPLELCSGAMLNWLTGISNGGSLVTYFSAHRKFNEWAWFDFLRMFNDRRRCAMDHFVFHEYRVDEMPPLGPLDRPDFVVRRATPNDREVVSDWLRRQDGELIYNVFDYSPHTLELENYRDDVDVADYERERGVWVAAVGERVLGIALAECAARGANIFSLFNIARLILLPDEETTEASSTAATVAPSPTEAEREATQRDRDEAVRKALFDVIGDFYRQRRLDDFMFYEGPGDSAPPSSIRSPFEVAGVRGVVSAEIAPHWMAYLNDIFGHRRAVADELHL
ncbi:MAG: hypothetical protein KC609_18365 [Myxococcales bacterium]|nr:hypothetical protein [Myxococcales bacterium]